MPSTCTRVPRCKRIATRLAYLSPTSCSDSPITHFSSVSERALILANTSHTPIAPCHPSVTRCSLAKCLATRDTALICDSSCTLPILPRLHACSIVPVMMTARHIQQCHRISRGPVRLSASIGFSLMRLFCISSTAFACWSSNSGLRRSFAVRPWADLEKILVNRKTVATLRGREMLRKIHLHVLT